MIDLSVVHLIRTCLNEFNKAQVAAVSGRDVAIDRAEDVITLKGVHKIVLAAGVEPNMKIPDDLAAEGFEVNIIGGCNQIAGITEAVAAGAKVGRKL
jgi:hypothetical protein